MAYGITDDVAAANSRSAADKVINSAKTYNKQLADKPFRAIEPERYITDADYREQLQFGTQAISTIVIPKTDTKVPVYLGTGPWELAHGAGHLYGSSLPVGGVDTHTVITAHAGVPGIELFTRLSELEIGDQFTVTTSNLRMTYQVKEIQTVLPDEVDSLGIVAGEDLVTLVTCTPININSHRLLVTGERVAQPLLPITAHESDFPWWAVIFVCGVTASVLLGIWMFRNPKAKPALAAAALPSDLISLPASLPDSANVSGAINLTSFASAPDCPNSPDSIIPQHDVIADSAVPKGRHLRPAQGDAQ